MSKPTKSIMTLTPKQLTRFWEHVDIGTIDDCWDFRSHKHKYGSFQHLVASRVAYFLHYGIDPGEQLVCHSCDNPPCCNPSHLFLGDYKANKQDCMDKGRHYHKLNSQQVIEIRQLLADGFTHRAIAKRFDVRYQTIEAIKYARTYQTNQPMPAPARLWGHDKAGEHNGNAKLNTGQVEEIRKQLALGVSGLKLAQEYGVKHPAIYAIKNGKRWNH